jgi:hypothetical protein
MKVRLTFVASTVCYKKAIRSLRLVRSITRWCQHSYRNRLDDQIEDRIVNVDQFAILLKLRLHFLRLSFPAQITIRSRVINAISNRSSRIECGWWDYKHTE